MTKRKGNVLRRATAPAVAPVFKSQFQGTPGWTPPGPEVEPGGYVSYASEPVNKAAEEPEFIQMQKGLARVHEANLQFGIDATQRCEEFSKEAEAAAETLHLAERVMEAKRLEYLEARTATADARARWHAAKMALEDYSAATQQARSESQDAVPHEIR